MNKTVNQKENRCICCNKEIETWEGLVKDAGFVVISFHYGSRLDQLLGFDGRKSEYDRQEPLQNLLACDKIEAFMCDNCFIEKYELFNGYERDLNACLPW